MTLAKVAGAFPACRHDTNRRNCGCIEQYNDRRLIRLVGEMVSDRVQSMLCCPIPGTRSRQADNGEEAVPSRDTAHQPWLGEHDPSQDWLCICVGTPTLSAAHNDIQEEFEP
jgi:hypothetical protein